MTTTTTPEKRVSRIKGPQRDQYRRGLCWHFSHGASETETDCVYCGRTVYALSPSAVRAYQDEFGPGTSPDELLSFDRILPGHLGGRYTYKNLVPACGPCNRKADRTPWALRWIGRELVGVAVRMHAESYRPRR